MQMQIATTFCESYQSLLSPYLLFRCVLKLKKGSLRVKLGGDNVFALNVDKNNNATQICRILTMAQAASRG